MPFVSKSRRYVLLAFQRMISAELKSGDVECLEVCDPVQKFLRLQVVVPAGPNDDGVIGGPVAEMDRSRWLGRLGCCVGIGARAEGDRRR